MTVASSNGHLADHLTDVVAYILEHKHAQLPSWHAEQAERERFTAMVAEALVHLRLPIMATGIQAAAKEMAGLLCGVGVLTPWLEEPGVEEIIVRRRADGRAHVQIERNGRIEDLGELAPMEHFEQVLRRAADSGGAVLKADSPKVVIDLPGGHRLTAIIPPLSAGGVALNIRRFSPQPLSLSDLVLAGSLASQAADFLGRVARLNLASILVAGASGAGKTTLLNAMGLEVPHTTQLAIAETFKELRPAHPYPLRAVAPAELKPHELQSGLDRLGDVVNTIYTRMRPDLIIVGEVVAAEAVEYLRAINLGARAWTTIHGGSCLGGLMSLESLAIQHGVSQPVARGWIARGVDLAVHLDRTPQGLRFVSEISRLGGLDERGGYRLQALYRSDLARGNRAEMLERLWAEMTASPVKAERAGG